MSAPAKPQHTRDEFACACCGGGLLGSPSSSYCIACDAAGCGEEDFRSADVCMVELRAKGFEVVGTCVERVQLRDRSIPLCRVEILRGPNGAHSYGRVMEVLS